MADTDDLGMTERTHALLEELVSRPTAGHGAKHQPHAQQARSHPPGRAAK
jgi:hypothetical protein